MATNRTRIVQHKVTGEIGRVQKGERKRLDGKVPVKFDSGENKLVNRENLKVIGYED